MITTKNSKQNVSSTPNKDIKLGVWSYANPNDAILEHFNTYKNFNTNMWRQAVRNNEQDLYLSLLEQNKDTDLSKTFYDPSYYNYESMMLELYKPFADATNVKEREREVWDYAAQAYTKESIGEMSEQEYIQYQIDKAISIRNEEITRQIELERKNNMSWFQKTGSYHWCCRCRVW